MAKAKSGDKVKVHYTGKFDNGDVFDSSEGREPLEFVIGEHHVIPGFEDAMMGMGISDKKSVEIEPVNAYGEVIEEYKIKYPKDQLPADMEIAVGMELEMHNDEGQTFNVLVVEVGESEITLDANHPLAGKKLIFDIELVEIL